MGSIGTTIIDKMLDHYFGDVALTPPASFDVALSTTQPADDGTGVTEPAGGSYARASSTNDATHWPNSSARSKQNGVAITFPAPTGSWGTCGWFAIYEGGTSNFVGWGQLAVARAIDATSAAPSFAPGTLIIQAPA